MPPLLPTPAFLIFWHRAGNTAAGISAVQAARRDGAPEIAGRAVRHGVEADLKWAGGAGAGPPLLYLYHGPTGLELLREGEVRRREAAGEVLTLERALDRPDADKLDYMIEVKRGEGPRRGAIAACAGAFERRGLVERLLFAASSLATLEEFRSDHPRVARCLFVTHVFAGGRVLHVPKIDFVHGFLRGLLPGPSALAAVDAISNVGPGRLRFRDAAAPGPAEIPRTVNAAETRTLLAAGLQGAFAYFDPEAIG